MNDIAIALSGAGITVDVLELNRLVLVRNARRIPSYDAVIIHSPLVYFWQLSLLAHFYSVPVVSLVWDVYPVVLGGERYDGSIRRRILDWVENLVLKYSGDIFVPSPDFLTVGRLFGAKVVKLWHFMDFEFCGKSRQGFCDFNDGVLKLLFCGQINRSRGLVASVERLNAMTAGRFLLKVASRDALPVEIKGSYQVEHVGWLSRPELKRLSAQCDCGLVSLADDFEGAGLPSKTFDYLKYGLPCLYYGAPLPYYVESLESSGAGINLSSINSLSRKDVLALKRNIFEASQLFCSRFVVDAQTFLLEIENSVSDLVQR